MGTEEITAKITENGQPVDEVTVKANVPGSVQEALDTFGEDVVYSRFRGSLVIDLQAYMRGLMKHKDGRKTNDEIQSLVSEWQPGVKKPGRSPAEKIEDLLGKLSNEDRAELLEKLAEAD